jgi:glycerol dehydrogenase-like iron-containing ADH family enzyme
MFTILSALVSVLSCRFRGRSSLELEVVALRQQLAVLRRQHPGRPRIGAWEWLLWALLYNGVVRYIDWAVPEAVYIDYDVIRAAPPQLNYSGIGDILCFHTGVLDWRYAATVGKCEAKWPYDEATARASLDKVENIILYADKIQLTDKGIEVLIDELRWGTSFHGNGWNPRHIEGTDHFFFYSLEYETGKKFLHGQPSA